MVVPLENREIAARKLDRRQCVWQSAHWNRLSVHQIWKLSKCLRRNALGQPKTLSVTRLSELGRWLEQKIRNLTLGFRRSCFSTFGHLGSITFFVLWMASCFSLQVPALTILKIRNLTVESHGSWFSLYFFYLAWISCFLHLDFNEFFCLVSSMIKDRHDNYEKRDWKIASLRTNIWDL